MRINEIQSVPSLKWFIGSLNIIKTIFQVEKLNIILLGHKIIRYTLELIIVVGIGN